MRFSLIKAHPKKFAIPLERVICEYRSAWGRDVGDAGNVSNRDDWEQGKPPESAFEMKAVAPAAGNQFSYPLYPCSYFVLLIHVFPAPRQCLVITGTS